MATRLSASRENLYSILGVAPESDTEAIRRAYVERIKEVHPDLNPAREEEAKRVNRAYEVLSDPVRRADHDRALFGLPCPFCGTRLESEAHAAPHVGRHLREPVPRRPRRRRRRPGEVLGVLIVVGAALWTSAQAWTTDTEPEAAIVPLPRAPRSAGGAPSALSGAPPALSGAPSIDPVVPHALCDPGELSRVLNDGVEADRAVVEALNHFATEGAVAPSATALAARLQETEARLDAARADALLPTPFAIEAGRLMGRLLGHDAEAVSAAAAGDVVAYNAATREAHQAHRKYAAHVLGHGPEDLCV